MPSRAPWTMGPPGSAMTYIPDDDPDHPFEGLSIFDADGDQIAIVPADLHVGLPYITERAQLMAAAPDLLHALHELRDVICSLCPNSNYSACGCRLTVIADRAIEKAEAQCQSTI